MSNRKEARDREVQFQLQANESISSEPEFTRSTSEAPKPTIDPALKDILDRMTEKERKAILARIEVLECLVEDTRRGNCLGQGSSGIVGSGEEVVSPGAHLLVQEEAGGGFGKPIGWSFEQHAEDFEHDSDA